MPCALCGDICRCSSDAYSAASPRWLPDAEACPDSATPNTLLETPEACELSPPVGDETALPNGGNESAAEEAPAWRLEVAARLNRYQARRKPRPPRYPSLRLRFDGEESAHLPAAGAESPAFPRTTPTVSNRALALDGFAESPEYAPENSRSEPVPSEAETNQGAAALARSGDAPRPAAAAASTAATTAPITAPTTAPTTAKIIEFPRSWTPPLAPLDELAEPVMHRPRILEAPEVVSPSPALGGITIETAQQLELEKRPGIDVPLSTAPVARRIFSAVIDGVIIVAACALFSFIFWRLTAIRPPRLQMLGLAAGLSSLFWAVYQYLLVVYSGTTPGLRLARLELARFDGSRPGRQLRRWRVIASLLSAASLGMGYAWVFLDEDSLCWHDRITHTYLAPTHLARGERQ